MRFLSDVSLTGVYTVALLAMAIPATAQVTQQSSPATAGMLQLSSSSAAAKAEFWLGVDDWQNFSPLSSLPHFQRAMSLDPSFGLARVFAAGVAPVRGESLSTAELARGVADAARASTAEGLLALAWREKAMNAVDAQITLLRFATELLPNEPRVASEYTWSLSAKDPKGAVEFGRAAKAKFPGFAPIYPALSYALQQAGDTLAALAEAERYAQLSPTRPASSGFYGELLMSAGRYAEAEAQYQHSLSLPPSGELAFNGSFGMAELMELRGNTAGARQVLAQAVQHAKSARDSIVYLQALAGAALYAKDVRSAMSTYETMATASASQTCVCRYTPAILMALTNAAFGDGKSVGKYLAPVHPLAAGDTLSMEYSFADLYAYTNQVDSAFKYADRLLARSATNATAGTVAHFARGQLYLTTGRCREALPEFRQSDTTSVEVQAGIATCEMEAGNRAVALQWRDRVVHRRDVNFFDPGEIRARLRMAELR